MFTPAFAATGREAVVLAIDGKPQHVRSLGKPGDAVVIEHDPQLFVHRVTPQS
jgi:hemin uptake protein HemP